MAEATHEDIIERIDALEHRMDAVEDGVADNGRTATELRTEFVAHRADFNEMMARWDGRLEGVTNTAKMASWALGIAVGIAALISAF